MHIPPFSWDGPSETQENGLLHLLILYPLVVLSTNLESVDMFLKLIPITSTLYGPLLRWDGEVKPVCLLSPCPQDLETGSPAVGSSRDRVHPDNLRLGVAEQLHHREDHQCSMQ